MIFQIFPTKHQLRDCSNKKYFDKDIMSLFEWGWVVDLNDAFSLRAVDISFWNYEWWLWFLERSELSNCWYISYYQDFVLVFSCQCVYSRLIWGITFNWRLLQVWFTCSHISRAIYAVIYRFQRICFLQLPLACQSFRNTDICSANWWDIRAKCSSLVIIKPIYLSTIYYLYGWVSWACNSYPHQFASWISIHLQG